MKPEKSPQSGLRRDLGLWPLTATGICAMLGAGINIVPFMIQRNVPGIGPYVLPAFLVAAVPALLAAFAYAMLSSAMPRAGGSYVYASRALNPYLGFIASFSQWFGLSIAIGVISYVIIPFIRDIAVPLDMPDVARFLEQGYVRLSLALLFLWLFVLVNIRGTRLYAMTLVPLMLLMFGLGAIVIFAGFYFDQQDFATALLTRESRSLPMTEAPFDISIFLAAAAVLFSSFIGFDAIAQAGGEAKNPKRSLPLAVGLAILVVGAFYMLFTAAVYHAVPWQFIAAEAQTHDITAPGLLRYFLSPGWTAAIVAGAAIALINDLPAMLLAVSRLMFAWAEDRIFPAYFARVHGRHHTPAVALIASGCMASVGIVGSHLAGDFFLGVDILVTSMLFNFFLMCLAVIVLPKRNIELARAISIVPSVRARLFIGYAGCISLGFFWMIHVWKDLSSTTTAWYFHSTPVWLIVMGIATIVYLLEVRRLRQRGINLDDIFKNLPPE